MLCKNNLKINQFVKIKLKKECKNYKNNQMSLTNNNNNNLNLNLMKNLKKKINT